MAKVLKQTEQILEQYNNTRDSDKEFLLRVMQLNGIMLDHQQSQRFRQMPPMESYTRARRKLQEEGKYPASEKVDDARFERFKEFKNNMASPEAVPWEG